VACRITRPVQVFLAAGEFEYAARPAGTQPAPQTNSPPPGNGSEWSSYSAITDEQRIQRMIDELRRVREHCEPKSNHIFAICIT
jgi:hypothetical protein